MQDIALTVGIVVFVLVLFVLAIMLFRALMYGRVPDAVEALEVAPVDGALVAERLSAAIRLQTVSDLDRSRIDYPVFLQLHQALAQMYPGVHNTLKRETVNQYSLLYTWQGSNPDLEPVLMVAHQDVVPFDPGTRDEWTHPPFDGVVADGFVWGRGALDMKCNLISTLEAVERLIQSGYQPERTLYLGFGHDEEIGGTQGAAAISALLAERGVHLAAVLDEGGSLVRGVVPGLSLPVALVGVSEKGHATIELRVEGRPGHSSAPPPHTSIGVLARALARLEAQPMPARPWLALRMFRHLGAFLPMSMRFVFANTWLFGGLVRKRLGANPQVNAMQRTSTAITVIRGGVKDNVLPSSARALVNFRLLPGDSLEIVLAHIRKVVKDDAVQIQPLPAGCWEASPVSSSDSPVFTNLSHTIRQVFPDALVSPYLVLGATDSRYYANICADVFRFSPYQLDATLLNSIHGIDERIGVETLAQMVQFYVVLIQSWTAPQAAA